MSGVNATVLLRQRIATERLGDVNSVLRDVAQTFTLSRKGRMWEFTVAVDRAPPHSFSIELVATGQRPGDYEDDLLQRGLDFDSAPEAFEVVAYSGNDSNRSTCETLARTLADLFDGINLGVRD